jgi:GST-like protein
MDKQLATRKFIACNQYTLADVAIFPWLRSWENQGIAWADYPHLKKWFDGVSARPAVQRGVQVLADLRRPLTGDKERDTLFGKTQYQKH